MRRAGASDCRVGEEQLGDVGRGSRRGRGAHRPRHRGLRTAWHVVARAVSRTAVPIPSTAPDDIRTEKGIAHPGRRRLRRQAPHLHRADHLRATASTSCWPHGSIRILLLHREHERDRRHGLRVVSAGAHNAHAVIGPSPPTCNCHGRLERSVGMTRLAVPRSVPADAGNPEAKRRSSSGRGAPAGVLRMMPPGGSARIGGAPARPLTVTQLPCIEDGAFGGPTTRGGAPPDGGCMPPGRRLTGRAAASTLSAASRADSGALASSLCE